MAVAAGARVGGLVLALGYLTGLVGGPLVGVVAGLALVTFGRCLRMDRVDQGLAATGLAVIAGSLGIATLRWGSLGLAELRSVQAVLGPTVLVGPEATATAVLLAAGAATLALALWVATFPGRGVVAWIWSVLETMTVALALVTAFWGPKVLLGLEGVDTSEVVGTVAVWAVASIVLVTVGVVGGTLARLVRQRVRVVAMVIAVLALLIAAGLIAANT